MMYNNKLAVALKSANGKVLREISDTVYIPFGSEYSILVKNLHTSARVKVQVFIDNNNVAEGQCFVIEPKSSLDLERFVKSQSQGNRFKFIERTAGVANHRGVDAEDGLIRVEFKYETEASVNRKWRNVYNNMTSINCSSDNSGMRGIGPSIGGPSCQLGSPRSRSSSNGATMDFMDQPTTQTYSAQVNDVGVTAPGSISNQQFHTAEDFETESLGHSMVLHILGETEDNKAIREPVTVKTKIECVSCGVKNKVQSKFCTECGTSLRIVA